MSAAITATTTTKAAAEMAAKTYHGVLLDALSATEEIGPLMSLKDI